MNFYKLARPDGYDFYTGKTINYRENIEKIVTCPNYNKEGELYSKAFIHASREPEQCFMGEAKIPCSAYLVSGKPIKEDTGICGFKSLKIIKELKPEELFRWRYREACNPVNPSVLHAPEITEKHKKLLKESISVWNSVKDSVKDLIEHLVGSSVMSAVFGSVWDSLFGDSIGDGSAFEDDSMNWDLVWDSVNYRVIRNSVVAYSGYIFQPVIPEWKEEYPYQSYVNLWKEGFIPVMTIDNNKYLWSKDRGWDLP